eukprot:1445947-Rhodomonas_salina.2
MLPRATCLLCLLSAVPVFFVHAGHEINQGRWAIQDHWQKEGGAMVEAHGQRKNTTIVIVPFCGLGNRLRAMSDAIQLNQCSEQLGYCPVYVFWPEDAMCNASYKSLFSSPEVPEIDIAAITNSLYAIFAPYLGKGWARKGGEGRRGEMGKKGEDEQKKLPLCLYQRAATAFGLD